MGLAKNYLNRTHFEKGFSGLQMRFHHCEIPVFNTKVPYDTVLIICWREQFH